MLNTSSVRPNNWCLHLRAFNQIHREVVSKTARIIVSFSSIGSLYKMAQVCKLSNAMTLFQRHCRVTR